MTDQNCWHASTTAEEFVHDPNALSSSVLTRRTALVAGATGFGALLLTACGGATVKAVPPTVPGEDVAGDVALAELLVGVENVAVALYQSALDGLNGGHFGVVPAALTAYLQTAMQHHRDHAAAWNAGQATAGATQVTGVDATLKAIAGPALAAAQDVPTVVRVVLDLEDVLAATYLNAVGVLHDTDSVKLATTIQPVEMQHSALLNFMLGQYPVPAPFATITGARTASDEIA